MTRRLRIACVQLEPVFKDPAASMRRADELLVSVAPSTLDLLVLPEMAFTGYYFQSREDVDPFAEDATSGPTFQWAAQTARRLSCYVVVGLPTSSAADGSQLSSKEFYNSLLIVSPSGLLTHVYHKHHLFGGPPPERAVDYLWATAGAGFTALDLPFPSSSPHAQGGATFRLVPGICMDLNERDFAPTDEYALASFAAEQDADVLLVAMSWLDSAAEEGLREARDPEGTDGEDEWRDVLTYWVVRSMPLLGSGAALVCANRVGREGDTVFTGLSCALELKSRPQVVKYASKRRAEIVHAVVELPTRDD
ncbi:amidase [Rhodotorula paludigena]|uniref:amidase n=1 Tax=Rhodotorula paludigena TaxID=86838 RepID=UPI00317E8A90